MPKQFHPIKVLITTFFLLFTLQAHAITANDLTSFVFDTAITANIRSKILLNSSLSNSKIDVGTVNGVVVLTGMLESDNEASALVQLATETDGVKEVDASRLIVTKGQQQLSDLIITAKIQGLFVRDKLYSSKLPSAMTINVDTKKAIVHLTGTAENQKQADFALEIARSVQGVDKVESTIQVK